MNLEESKNRVFKGSQQNTRNQSSVNEGIQNGRLRVISSTGEQLGIMNRDHALNRAFSEGLDLVVISPNQEPPVAKIMNYGKYKFEQEKQEKENKRKNKNQSVLKEFKMSVRIDEHDLQVKIKKIIECLSEGDKVKIIVIMHGREVEHANLGNALMMRIFEMISLHGKADREPAIRREGKTFTLTMVSNNQ